MAEVRITVLDSGIDEFEIKLEASPDFPLTEDGEFDIDNWTPAQLASYYMAREIQKLTSTPDDVNVRYKCAFCDTDAVINNYCFNCNKEQ
jgi:hypothetical protein